MANISVALSGGGHRAALFALGALQYLADAGKNVEVTSIASVSGGSLTNGFVGQTVAYNEVNGSEFQAQVTDRLLSQLTEHGTLFAPKLTKFYLALVGVVLASALIGVWFLPGISLGWRVLMCLAGICVALALAWFRGAVCRHALRVTLFSPNGSASKLVDMKPGVDHVLCATDLQSGDHFYLARDLAYGYQFGTGTPGDTTMAIAVGASAALPGAFTPVSIRTAGLGLRNGQAGADAARLHLVDGGVYDNMADQWASGYRARTDRLPASYADRLPDELIVVNASSGAHWSPTSMLGVPIVGEVKAILRDKSILYDNTTTHRRVALVDRFDLARERGTGMTGTYVGINQSPFRVARFFKDHATFGGRARQVLSMLEAAGISEAAWDQVTRASDSMSTNLSRIDQHAASDVVWHAYVLTMCNLHVLLGYPIEPGLPSRDRFASSPRN